MPLKVRKAMAFSTILLISAMLKAQATGEVRRSLTQPKTKTDLKTELDSLVIENSIPGVAVALVFRDSMWLVTSGLADMEKVVPITENTHFRIGSCTKSFIGLGFLKLLNEGRIDLDIPVKKIAPEIEIHNGWQETHPVRIANLLEHSAGFDDSYLNWFYFKGPVIPLQGALEAKSDLRKVRWQPGTRFSYSSPGYTLAGYILEKTSGQEYEDYLKQAILEPMGMNTSTIGRARENMKLLAMGYEKDNKPVPYWYDYDEPAGAMSSSIKEMALFVQFMLNKGRTGGEQIISSELIDRVGKPTSTIAVKAGLEAGYNFGVSARFRDNQKWYGHGGLIPGFFADYSYNSDCGVGYVVLVNRGGRVVDIDVIDAVESYCVCDMESSIVSSVQLSESQAKAYCGYYEFRSSRMQLFGFVDILLGGITISYGNDTLYEQSFMSDKEPLIPVSQNMFRKSNHPEASRVFAKTPNGKMVYATMGLYYERIASWKPLLYRALVFGALIIMISAIPYALFWIPLYVFRRLRSKEIRAKYLRMRVIPLLAVTTFLSGFIVIMIADQTILELGQKTLANMIFFISTLVFAGLSTLSLVISYKSFFKPVKKIARIYTVILSSACFGMTLYLGYWGLIGIRLWAY